MADDLDDRRRAMFLFNLAINYRETGDVEAAIRTGTQGLALLRAAGSSFESAQIENDLAMAYLATGNVARARELAGEARREFEQAGDGRYLSAVLDTEARVALASDDAGEAIKLARRAVALAEQSGNQAVQLGAMLTEARALRANGDRAKAESAVRRGRCHCPRRPCPLASARRPARVVRAPRRRRGPSRRLRAHPRGAGSQLNARPSCQLSIDRGGAVRIGSTQRAGVGTRRTTRRTGSSIGGDGIGERAHLRSRCVTRDLPTEPRPA